VLRVARFLDKHQIPKTRALIHVALSFITAGVWVFIAILIELFIASQRENKIWSAQQRHHEELENLIIKIKDKKKTMQDLIAVKKQVQESIDTSYNTPFELPIAWLWESREKITSVTSGTTLGKTRTGTVGLGWNDGIGWAASQGVTRGTIASQTTEMISNEFMQLDSGVFRIGKEFTAFIGDQFSRTSYYKDFLAINTQYDKTIGLGIVNSDRIWMTKFPADFEKVIASHLLNDAHSRATKNEAQDLTSLLEQFNSHVEELKSEISSLENELAGWTKPTY
jgi:hypothetical protein